MCLRNMLQEDLLLDFPRHQTEADLPVALQRWFISEDNWNISLSTAVRTPWPFKDDRVQSWHYLSLRNCGCIQSDHMDLHGLSCMKQTLTGSLSNCDCSLWILSLNRCLEVICEYWGKECIEYLIFAHLLSLNHPPLSTLFLRFPHSAFCY